MLLHGESILLLLLRTNSTSGINVFSAMANQSISVTWWTLIHKCTGALFVCSLWSSAQRQATQLCGCAWRNTNGKQNCISNAFGQCDGDFRIHNANGTRSINRERETKVGWLKEIKKTSCVVSCGKTPAPAAIESNAVYGYFVNLYVARMASFRFEKSPNCTATVLRLFDPECVWLVAAWRSTVKPNTKLC